MRRKHSQRQKRHERWHTMLVMPPIKARVVYLGELGYKSVALSGSIAKSVTGQDIVTYAGTTSYAFERRRPGERRRRRDDSPFQPQSDRD